MNTEQAMMTPDELARRWDAKSDKVYYWIRTGELRAVNVAFKKNGQRPRWRIPLEEVLRFEEARTSTVPLEPQRRRRRSKQTTGTEYF